MDFVSDHILLDWRNFTIISHTKTRTQSISTPTFLIFIYQPQNSDQLIPVSIYLLLLQTNIHREEGERWKCWFNLYKLSELLQMLMIWNTCTEKCWSHELGSNSNNLTNPFLPHSISISQIIYPDICFSVSFLFPNSYLYLGNIYF